MNAPAMPSYGRVGARPETDVILSYQVDKVSVNAAGNDTMVRFAPNSAYDVDPTLGSTATPFFNEYASIYSYYRVIKVTYDVTVVNNEAFPLRCYSMFANTDPGTIGHYALAGNPLVREGVVSAKGGMDRVRLRGSSTVSAVVGTKGVEMEDNFRAAVTASPVDLIWLGFGARSPGSGVAYYLANGVTVAGCIKMYVRFYDVKVTIAAPAPPVVTRTLEFPSGPPGGLGVRSRRTSV